MEAVSRPAWQRSAVRRLRVRILLTAASQVVSLSAVFAAHPQTNSSAFRAPAAGGCGDGCLPLSLLYTSDGRRGKHGRPPLHFLPQPPLLLEELRENLAARPGQHAGDDLAAMVQARIVQQVVRACGPPRPWDRRRRRRRWNPRLHDRPGTHRTRLQGHVQRATVQPPRLPGRGRLRDGDHLGVGGRIVQLLPLVVRRAITRSSCTITAPIGHFLFARRPCCALLPGPVACSLRASMPGNHSASSPTMSSGGAKTSRFRPLSPRPIDLQPHRPGPASQPQSRPALRRRDACPAGASLGGRR